MHARNSLHGMTLPLHPCWLPFCSHLQIKSNLALSSIALWKHRSRMLATLAFAIPKGLLYLSASLGSPAARSSEGDRRPIRLGFRSEHWRKDHVRRCSTSTQHSLSIFFNLSRSLLAALSRKRAVSETVEPRCSSWRSFPGSQIGEEDV
jgi:hypothetical protein